MISFINTYVNYTIHYMGFHIRYSIYETKETANTIYKSDKALLFQLYHDGFGYIPVVTLMQFKFRQQAYRSYSCYACDPNQ